MTALRVRVAGWATDHGYAAGWALVRALPEPVAQALFRAGGDLAHRRAGRGAQQLRSNLSRVAPALSAAELDALTRAALRSYARYWCEAFRLPAMDRARIVGGMNMQDEQRLRASVASGRGTIMALPHTGNWDHAGAWCALTGIPFTTVAERLSPASVFDRFVAFRESLGMEVIPLTGGDRPPSQLLAERLTAGGTLCLLADRDLSARGIDVQFFDAPARMPAGPATLALRTGATLLPVTLSFMPSGWRAVIHDAVPHSDPATMTQAIADAFSEGIAAHPADWHMLQRLWLDDLPTDDARRTQVPG